MSTTIPSATEPTNIPAGDRRTARVAVPIPRPTTVAGTLRAAARLLAAVGLHQGDHCADPCDRVLSTPHSERPMSITAAVRCAATGDPHVELRGRNRDQSRRLADAALGVLAVRLMVGGESGPAWGSERETDAHVDAWGDVEGRTTESACVVLYAAADSVVTS